MSTINTNTHHGTSDDDDKKPSKINTKSASKSTYVCRCCNKKGKTESGLVWHLQSCPLCFDHFKTNPQNKNKASTYVPYKKRKCNRNNRNNNKPNEYTIEYSNDPNAFEPIWDNENELLDPHCHYVKFSMDSMIQKAISKTLNKMNLFDEETLQNVNDNAFDEDLKVLDALNMIDNHNNNNDLNEASQDFDNDDDSEGSQDSNNNVHNKEPNIQNVMENENLSVDKNMFYDTADGSHTHDEIFALELLTILRDCSAPNYAYDKIIKIVKTLMSSGVTSIQSSFHRRHTTIKYFSERFKMNSLKPTKTKHFFNGKSYPVVKHNAYAMIQSLLTDTNLNQDCNYLFANPDDPLGDLPTVPTTYGDIDSGSAYRDGFKNTKQNANDLPCPLIIYMDKLTVDRHGHLSLEPVYFSLGIYNRSTRNHFSAW